MLPEIRFYVGDFASLGPFALDRAITLGRGECDLPIPDDGLSRLHCRVEPDPHGGVLVTDLGSTNGIYFEGAVVRETRVAFGEEFWIGRTRCMIAVAGVAAQALPKPGQPPMPYGGPTPPPRPAYVGADTPEETRPVMASVERTAPPFVAPNGLGRFEKTQPPFPAGGATGAEGSGRTQPPFPAAYPAGGAAPLAGGAPEIRVFVQGQPCRVTNLDLHYATGQDGTPYLRVVVGFENGVGAIESAAIWLAGA